MSIQNILSNVPDYKAFLTVEELNNELIKLGDEYPNKVSVDVIGKSTKGRDILCAKIGSGSRNALFYGCPHPNEPIGAMMSHYFARAIAENDSYREELDFTFYIIPVSDVDGTILNEKWFKGPFNLYNYARNFYRPASHLQVEWTFPMNYKTYKFNTPMPETRALMKVIDETQPKFIYSLHNAGFGGTYWYVSHEQPQNVYDALYNSSKSMGVPLNLGEPEMPFAISFAPAFYKMPFAKDIYDYFEQYTPGDPAQKMFGGECSGAYAGSDTTELVAELPYFLEPRVNSEKELDFPRSKAVEQKLDITQGHLDDLKLFYERAKPYYTKGNLFASTLDNMLKMLPSNIDSERAFVKTSKQFSELCKESEAFSNIEMTKFYHLLNWGTMVRSVECEIESSNSEAKTALKNIKQDAENMLKLKTDELEAQLNYSVIPIRNLVIVQLESALRILEQL